MASIRNMFFNCPFAQIITIYFNILQRGTFTTFAHMLQSYALNWYRRTLWFSYVEQPSRISVLNWRCGNCVISSLGSQHDKNGRM